MARDCTTAQILHPAFTLSSDALPNASSLRRMQALRSHCNNYPVICHLDRASIWVTYLAKTTQVPLSREERMRGSLIKFPSSVLMQTEAYQNNVIQGFYATAPKAESAPCHCSGHPLLIISARICRTLCLPTPLHLPCLLMTSIEH